MKRRSFMVVLALFTAISLLTVFIISCDNDNGGGDDNTDNSLFDIRSPYESVNWSTFGQYKAALHAHTTNSDGSAAMLAAVNEHYRLGYDILGITDHVWKRDGSTDLYLDFITRSWTETHWKSVPLSFITEERLAQIQAGEGRDGRGMLMIPRTNEFAFTDAEEMNVFFFNGTAAPTAWDRTIRQGMQVAYDDGSFFFINHPGRTTNAANFTGSADSPDNPSNKPSFIRKYANLYMEFPHTSLVGMEIFNRRDGDSRHDRVLWDNVLKLTVPEGRFIWGYGNDDSHSISGININYNMFIMPENTPENLRNALINGHSYAVTCAAFNEGVDYPATSVIRPVIKNISVDNAADTITIEAENTIRIVWISEGRTILTTTGGSSTINLTDEEIKEGVGSYVRADVIGNGGMATIQPIGTKRRK